MRDRLAGFAPTYALTTIAGGMPLEEYLRTRTFELVVHGLDIQRACGVDPAFAPDALTDGATLAAEAAVLTGRGAGPAAGPHRPGSPARGLQHRVRLTPR